MGLLKQKFKSIRHKYIGDKHFYRMTLSVALPIMIQNGITNLVSLLDNVMVGKLGTEAMSGISIVNQFIFIFNLLVFGSIAAAGIYIAQYYGLGDEKGLRYSFRFKFLITLAASAVGVAVLFIFHEQLIGIFLHESDSVGNLELTLEFGKEYLFIMLIGLVPYAISQVYASTLRETGETIVPMISCISAVAVNFILNIVLIFGHLGFPALGVKGAAIATVASRFVELFILIVYAHMNTKRFSYLRGAYSSFRIPSSLFREISVRGIPLLINEFLWALAMTLRNQCYSTRGLDVVAAQNISATVFNLFNVVYMSMGAAIAIIIGNLLGAGKIEEAKDQDRKLVAFSVFAGFVITILMIVSSFFFPNIYNTEESVRSLASYMMVISGLTMPLAAYACAAYFTIRSGGKVFITILFDSVYMWVITMPVSIIFAYLTQINIFWLFVICQFVDTLKCIFGAILLKRGNWAHVLVQNEN